MKWGVFVKKVEMVAVFCKKSGPFLNAGCIMYSISILFYILLIWGVRTHPTHPYGPGTCANARQHSDDSDAARHAAPFID